MSMTLITAPALEPITLADAKVHLRVDGTAEDTAITSMIVAARRMAEHRLNRALITQTWELALDAFDTEADVIKLPLGRALSVVSIKYLDATNFEQTMNASLYTLDAAATPSTVRLATGTSWPSTYSTANAVKVRYTAGYGAAASNVPADVIAWMLLQIGAMHRHASAIATGVSVSELPGRFVDGLLDAERVYL